MFESKRKMWIFEDSSPYFYDESKDTIVYRTDFGHVNPEAIYPDASDHIDGLRVAKVTTWTPDSREPDYGISSYNLANGQKELADKIDFIFWGKHWICNPVVQIGVYNSKPEDGPVDFTIRMRDFAPKDTYPRQVRVWSEIYDMALEGVDANDTSL